MARIVQARTKTSQNGQNKPNLPIVESYNAPEKKVLCSYFDISGLPKDLREEIKEELFGNIKSFSASL